MSSDNPLDPAGCRTKPPLQTRSSELAVAVGALGGMIAAPLSTH